MPTPFDPVVADAIPDKTTILNFQLSDMPFEDVNVYLEGQGIKVSQGGKIEFADLIHQQENHHHEEP